MRARVFLSGATVISLWAAACGGEHRRAADVNWTTETIDEGSQAVRQTEAIESSEAPQPLEASAAPRSLTGVRPDLALSTSAAAAARCACLAVAVGSPSSSNFQWQAGAPEAGPQALAIAVSSRGVECPGGDPDETKRRPSISAVDVEGNDVIVEVEELPDGPPLASGALIPQPGPGGSVYVRGKSQRVPYARGAAGGSAGARCKVR